VADRLPDGYGAQLPSGRTFGEALLDPTVIYVELVRALLADDVAVHYHSHITGHGLLKLMRPRRELSYRITRLPDVPEVLDFLAAEADMSARAAYSTFNMGCGFAVYCAAGAGEEVVAHAAGLGLSAHVAGGVEDGPRRVVLAELGIVYESGDLDLSPRQAP
jgi:phosphoribosylformylglycinamidine cyclo-ligase